MASDDVSHCSRVPSTNASDEDEALPSTLDAEEAHCSACASIVRLGKANAAAAITADTASTSIPIVFLWSIFYVSIDTKDNMHIFELTKL